MAQHVASAPFTRAVVNAVRRLYPESLADKTWDNTGLLLEAPFNPARRQKNRVLLTIDLTKAVADEAIEQKVSIVVAYHPIIFRGLKSITLGDTQQQSLLRLAAEGISVYSPHSAFDAAPHGLGDWLADMIAGESVEYGKNDSDEETSDTDSEPSSKEKLASSEGDIKPNEQVHYKWRNMTLHHFPSQRATESTFNTRLDQDAASHERSAIKPINGTKITGAGMGRIVRFKDPERLQDVIDRVIKGVGSPKSFLLATPQGSKVEDLTVRAAAICAGSGGSLFTSAPEDTDLFFTGELSHHEALAQTERGRSVVCLMHSNTERGFLHQVLKSQLQDAVRHDWKKLRNHERADKSIAENVREALEDESVTVEVSERDRDPFGFVVCN